MGLGIVALLIIGAGAAMVLLLSGVYSTAATKQHFRITYRFLEMGLRYSVAANADDISVPDLDKVANADIGLACYRTHCSQCHGAPGVSREALGLGQLPAASDLTQTARDWPPAHLFYVTQKGIRMSGMPAWEYRISEDGLWSTVAFLRTMPSMTRRDYERAVVQNDGHECPSNTAPVEYSEENAQILLRQYACDNCHQIEGLVGPKTFVGPLLHEYQRRKFIAGTLPNTHANLVRWIVDPHEISPTTLMPDLGVPEAHARVMAQYFLGYE